MLKKVIIKGNINGKRVSSRILEEQIQNAVREGVRELHISADGQHGIGGRIWPRQEKISLTVEGPVGQRLGSMGMHGTEIVVKGGVSDDVGWLNCGAKITVLGDVTNGAHNAGAQGILYVQGGGGARCDTMTKFNPRLEPLQSWYFRDVGDSFAEFKAGGFAVVCGVNPRNPENILGYRPCVGMVGGTIFFRGPAKGYRERDVKCVELSPQDWQWLTENMKPYLQAIDRVDYYEELTRSPDDWKKIIAYTPAEKAEKRRAYWVDTSRFRAEVWEPQVGRGGIFAEYLTHEQTLLPYITTGDDRRNRPVWSNGKYSPPCAYNCPTHIPTHKRARLIRDGKLQEALRLVLQYSPLPATVCGQICPNLCMQSCTRSVVDTPFNVPEMGKLSLNLKAPKRAKSTGYTIAVVGGGPAGLSVSWQLSLKGHGVDLYEAEGKLGGKVELCIPRDRLPQKVLRKEIARFKEVGVNVHLKQKINRKKFEKIYKDHDLVVVACGAHEPLNLTFPGSENAVTAVEFLKGINFGDLPTLKNRNVVILGAGNVGMDAATQAFACGAQTVTAADIQKPLAFGKELETAKAKGTAIVYPKFVKRYDKKAKKLFFKDDTQMDADLVIVAIGEKPITDFLPQNIHTEKGWLVVNDLGQTSDVKVFAIGDATKPGLVTHAIGQGRTVAEVIHAQLMRYDYMPEIKQPIAYGKIKTAYYERCAIDEFSPKQEAEKCLSCGTCRDCHMCETVCYWGAISRKEKKGDDPPYEYLVDSEKCIGCGFCAGTCPCGIWEMVENV
jgi:NADPH-dependent glutamate synthase beta subunit-like oxidoreductase/glutamate synthase domain-containing protein 3/NAD-dependent dihydropyrimidine dehydrogenase PreA subunit